MNVVAAYLQHLLGQVPVYDVKMQEIYVQAIEMVNRDKIDECFLLYDIRRKRYYSSSRTEALQDTRKEHRDLSLKYAEFLVVLNNIRLYGVPQTFREEYLSKEKKA